MVERNGSPGTPTGIWYKGMGLIIEDNSFWGCADGPDAAGECNRITTEGGLGEPVDSVYRGSGRILREWSPRTCTDLSEDLEDLD